jgi:cytochrome c oxidase subunit III
MSARPVIDVSERPSHGMDHTSPLWWGNILMLIIETTMFALTAASYFYTRLQFQSWPPLGTRPPSLGVTTANLLVMLVGVLPMIGADRAARRNQRRMVQMGYVLCLVLGLTSIVLRTIELDALNCKWSSHAYGSIVWLIYGMHLLHLIAANAEILVLTVWVFTHELDAKHRLDITITATYWYWVPAVWVPMWAMTVLGPRVM